MHQVENEEILSKILLKSLMALPQADFSTALFMVPMQVVMCLFYFTTISTTTKTFSSSQLFFFFFFSFPFPLEFNPKQQTSETISRLLQLASHLEMGDFQVNESLLWGGSTIIFL